MVFCFGFFLYSFFFSLLNPYYFSFNLESKAWDLIARNFEEPVILRNRSTKQDKWKKKDIKVDFRLYYQVGHQTGDWHSNRWHILRSPTKYVRAIWLGDKRQKHFFTNQFPPLFRPGWSLDINSPALLNALQGPKNVPHSMCHKNKAIESLAHDPKKGTFGLHLPQLVES